MCVCECANSRMFAIKTTMRFIFFLSFLYEFSLAPEKYSFCDAIENRFRRNEWKENVWRLKLQYTKRKLTDIK